MDKIISFRVPLDTYIQLLKEASELKMSMSDYMLIKLDIQGEKGSNKAVKSKIKAFTTKVEAFSYIREKHADFNVRGKETKLKPGDKLKDDEYMLEYKSKGQLILYALK